MGRRQRKPEYQNPFDPTEGRVDGTLDLHGMTASEGRIAVQNFLLTSQARYPRGLVHIITGKGLRSSGGPVLKRVVRGLLEQNQVWAVHAWAPDADDGGYMIRLKG